MEMDGSHLKLSCGGATLAGFVLSALGTDLGQHDMTGEESLGSELPGTPSHHYEFKLPWTIVN